MNISNITSFVSLIIHQTIFDMFQTQIPFNGSTLHPEYINNLSITINMKIKTAFSTQLNNGS